MHTQRAGVEQLKPGLEIGSKNPGFLKLKKLRHLILTVQILGIFYLFFITDHTIGILVSDFDPDFLSFAIIYRNEKNPD